MAKFIADEAAEIFRRMQEIQRAENRRVEEPIEPAVSDFDGKARKAASVERMPENDSMRDYVTMG